jgi:nicotinamide-nucleotide amidase
MSQQNEQHLRPPDGTPTTPLDQTAASRDERVACLAEALEARGMRLVTAESCTGGLLAANLTDRAGSSGWFDCGFVTYSNRAKQRDLGVPGQLFAEVGAVSGEVVAAMAEGAIDRSGVEYAVAISGVAGPGGGSEAKPVGTVWFAWAWSPPPAADGTRPEGAQTFTARYRFPGDRRAVREAAVDVALEGLCTHLGGGDWTESAAGEWSSAHWPAAGLKL